MQIVPNRDIFLPGFHDHVRAGGAGRVTVGRRLEREDADQAATELQGQDVREDSQQAFRINIFIPERVRQAAEATSGTYLP